MKIGIVTIDNNYNYGNRLQNYATCNLIKNHGHSVDTIVVKAKESGFQQKQSNIKQVIKHIISPYIMYKIISLKEYVKSNFFNDIQAKRNRIFSKFTDIHIQPKIFYVEKYEDTQKISNFSQYDYFFVGSDQVWNPYFAGSDYYFLTFAPPEKRIGFIASFGITELPDGQKHRYAELLNQMQYISVREKSAVRIIENLIDKKTDCFLDPVLLLEKKYWENLIKPTDYSLPQKYILSFFLGEEPKEKIEVFADNHDLDIIRMDRKEYKKYYLLGPDQLLYMIKNAAIIMTDSFHVTAFSIIFQKQFYAFRRKELKMENMFSRIESLLETLHLTDRIQDEDEIWEKEDITSNQFYETDLILMKERKRFDMLFKKIRNCS